MWLKLTDKDDIPILVNMSNIEAVMSNEGDRFTSLNIHGVNEAYYVKESLEEIYKMLKPKESWS